MAKIKNDVGKQEALIRRTDKDNPKPEDIGKLRAAIDQNAWLIEANELCVKALDRVFTSVSPAVSMKELLQRQKKEKRAALVIKSPTSTGEASSYSVSRLTEKQRSRVLDHFTCPRISPPGCLFVWTFA